MAKSTQGRTSAQRQAAVRGELAELRSSLSDQQDSVLQLQAQLDAANAVNEEQTNELTDLHASFALAAEQTKEAQDLAGSLIGRSPTADSSYKSTQRLCLDFPMALCGMFGIAKALHTPSFVQHVKDLLGSDSPRLRQSPLRILLAGGIKGISRPIRTIPAGAAKRVEQCLTALDVIETVYFEWTAQGESQDAIDIEVPGSRC